MRCLQATMTATQARTSLMNVNGTMRAFHVRQYTFCTIESESRVGNDQIQGFE